MSGPPTAQARGIVKRAAPSLQAERDASRTALGGAERMPNDNTPPAVYEIPPYLSGVGPEYLKRVEACASASVALAELYREIAEGRAEMKRAVEAKPCTRASRWSILDQYGREGRVPCEPGEGEECWKDGQWHERHFGLIPGQSEPGWKQQGYCDGCTERAPLARKLKALRARKCGVTRAVLTAGRLLLRNARQEAFLG